jgi:hypothetical protein
MRFAKLKDTIVNIDEIVFVVWKPSDAHHSERVLFYTKGNENYVIDNVTRKDYEHFCEKLQYAGGCNGR